MATKTTTRDVRRCFVIMPFGKKKDPQREDEVDFDQVFTKIIKPAVEAVRKYGVRISCERAKDVERAGFIHERMIRSIAEADVAVVDLTTENPNVYYELGVRHALKDRVTVLVRREGPRGTANPFNIAGMTTIGYDLDEAKAAQARTAITNFVRNGLLSGAKDSLVTSLLPDLTISWPLKTITESDVEEYDVPDAPGKRIGIVSGNLRNTNLSAKLLEHPIDVWVSSENINMEMARRYEGSISAMIRYLGAEKDETSTIVKDTIANELQRKMKGRQFVNPGEVVATGAGRLAETHNVKRIFHAASVYGVVGSGYHPIAHVEHCITNALAKIDWDARPSQRGAGPGKKVPKEQDVESILFPLLGTGNGRAEIIQSARKQLGAAIGYLRSRAKFTRIERVYFLAPTETFRDGIRVAMAELGIDVDKQERPTVKQALRGTAKRRPRVRPKAAGGGRSAAARARARSRRQT